MRPPRPLASTTPASPPFPLDSPLPACCACSAAPLRAKWMSTPTKFTWHHFYRTYTHHPHVQLSPPFLLLYFYCRTNNTFLYKFVYLPHLPLLDWNLLPVRELWFISVSPKHSSVPGHRKCSINVCCMNELTKCLKRKKFQVFEEIPGKNGISRVLGISIFSTFYFFSFLIRNFYFPIVESSSSPSIVYRPFEVAMILLEGLWHQQYFHTLGSAFLTVGHWHGCWCQGGGGYLDPMQSGGHKPYHQLLQRPRTVIPSYLKQKQQQQPTSLI